MRREAINETTISFLLTPAARSAAAALGEMALPEEQTFAILQQLRRDFDPSEAGALLALARLRQKAMTKFPDAAKLFLTAEALEQATAWPIAQKRAAWIATHAPDGPILDLGCGIGGDLLALAAQRPVIGIEIDPVRLQCARANVDALGLTERVQLIEADWPALLHAGKLPDAAAAFADPARRVDGRRIFSLYQVQPPLPALLALQQQIAALGIKVMPGVDDAELPAGCSVEFISHEGVCKEAVLWFGPLTTDQRRASVHTASGWITLADDGNAPPLGDLRVGLFLHEPDPAVIRAGAFAPLCEQLSAWLFDAQIAYLVSAVQQTSPLVQTFAVREVHDFSLRRLNQRLEALGVGAVELKKRGFPTEPESLRPRLKLQLGGRPLVVIFTRRGDQRLMILADRLSAAR
ncbi:MAG: methyltransferase domain-containing protein [Caldilineaceae bacterium]|nr:methyltransferase domain-containing protein [Caldilineaceae bacterium]